jgi:two-component system, chemotaxis family, sensor kinase CheA
MIDSNRVQSLLQALGREISAAKAGSNDGQFPILDLVGNLRDESGKRPDLQPLFSLCTQAWERIVNIVESGRAFEVGEIQWLVELRTQLEKLVSVNIPEAAGTGEALSPQATPPQPSLTVVPSSAQPAPGEDAPLGLDLQSDGELLREFINESREHLDNIEQGVLVLERQPGDAETLNTVFRAFHTFKGSAGFLNLMPINRLAHVLESLLDLARQGKLEINPPIIDLILRGRDVLKQFVDEIEGQVNGSKPVAPIQIPIAGLKTDVLAVVEHGPTCAPRPSATTKEPSGPMIPEGGSGMASSKGNAEVPAKAETPAPRPRVETPVQSGAGELSAAGRQGAVVKVDTGKLDALLDMVGEMVIAQSLVVQDLSDLSGLSPQFLRNMGQLTRITRELQRVSMSMRMLPIRGLFHKMTRVVRDLSAKQQKQVQLLTSGEDTELDRGVVEELNDPLLHMIRNSIDHGIEPATVRAAGGKPAVASIHLRAFHQGGNIVLEIEDDGAGLNKERILAKAIERGLVAADDQVSEEEIYNLIFAPGFSTAEKITDVSGRGVGLDVVRRNIEQLRGCVDIASKPGQGTLFKITLPLTLAIIDGLIVKVGEERYIIPTLSVRESFRPRADMITRVQGAGEVVNVRGRLIPLLRLHESFGVTPASTDPTQGIVVVAQSGANYRCLLVDSLLHKQEVVIKNLNDLMIHKNHALAGAAILGDGRVGLILDVNALVHLENQCLSKAA